MGTGKSVNRVMGLLLAVIFIFTNTAYSLETTLRVPLQSGRRAGELLNRVTGKDQALKRATEAVRTCVIGGNWKMEVSNKEEAGALLKNIIESVKGENISGTEVVVGVPIAFMDHLSGILRNAEANEENLKGKIKIAAQNIAGAEKGAFTGRTSILQVKDLGAKYVIIGHSEQRRDKSENLISTENEAINNKVHLTFKEELVPIVCIGESLAERTDGRTNSVVEDMIRKALAGLNKEQVSNLIVAYEPVWAIGTGKKAATPQQAQEVLRFIRRLILDMFDEDTASKVRIIYGGSVKPDNIAGLMDETVIPDNDGALIGGASLKADSFIGIIKGVPVRLARSADKTEPAVLTGRMLFDSLKKTEAGRQAVIMSTNIRSPLSLEGLIEGAMETESVVIFQQAKSELGYTWENGKGHEPENAHRFAEEVRETARKLGFSDYVIKADHVTVTVNKEFLADKDSQNKIAVLFDDILSEKDNLARSNRFMQAFNDAEFMSNPNTVSAMKAIKEAYNLVAAEVDAGMTVFALDASFMPMRLNTRITAFMAGLIPENCSIEAEVGEIGGANNSTVADALEFLTGVRYQEEILERDEKGNILYAELVLKDGKPVELARDKGLLDYGVKIDKIALNNGTAHGNNYDAQGNLIVTQMNLRMTTVIAKAIAPYSPYFVSYPSYDGTEIVQHGITGTPLENLPALRAAGITEGHVGTEWQNKIWDVLVEEAANGSQEAMAIVDSMIDMLISNYGPKYKVTDKASSMPADLRVLKTSDLEYKSDLKQLIGKEVKNTLGAHKARMLALPDSIKKKINADTKESAVAHFNAFGSTKTARLVREYVSIPNPPRLMGGRDVNTIVKDLATVGAIGREALLDSDILKEEFIEHNAQGTLADFLANLSELDVSHLNLELQEVNDGIEIVVSSIGLNRVENEQDIIVLPASKISEMENMQVLNGFLISLKDGGKAVVIVSDNEDSLSIIRNKFLADTGRDLEKLAWLKVLKGANLEPLEAIYSQFGLDIQCSLEKVQDKALANAIKRGV